MLQDYSEIQEAASLFDELIKQRALVSSELYRGDQLENILVEMCRRAGFNGAVLADTDGLPLAIHNNPVGNEEISAFTTVLGMAMERAGSLLGEYDVNNISLDVNYTDKAVLRKFVVSDTPFFLMIICPQEVDERSEVELTINQITSILAQG